MTPTRATSIGPILRAHPRRTIAVVLLMALAGAAEGIGLLTLLPLLASAGYGGDPSSLLSRTVAAMLRPLGPHPDTLVLCGVVVAAIVAKAGFRWVAMTQVGVAVAAVAAELRTRLLAALFSARWSHFAELPIGGVAGTLTRDAYWAAFAYRDACAALAAAIQLAVYALAVLLVSWKIGLLALGVGLAVCAPLGVLVRVSRRAGAGQTRHSLRLVARAVDVLQALKPIRAMGREPAFLRELQAETAALRGAEESHVRATEALRALQEPLLAIVVLSVLVAALLRGGQDLPTVVVLAVLFQRMAGRFQAVQTEYQAMVAAASACSAVLERIEEAERSREENDGATPAPEIRASIEVRSVSFRHGSHAVLRGASLSIAAGSFVAIVGESGAGKSTLLDLLAGLREPEGGTVLADGIPLREMERESWRETIGYVPQESVLLNGTVLSNVLQGRSGLGARDAERALSAAGAGPLLARLPEGLGARVGERGLRLSGGERRRLALARALVGRPRLLLLDEATAELDPASAAAIGRTLRALRGSLTIVAVTHHPALAAMADAVYRLAEGRLTSASPTTARNAARHSAGSGERESRQAPPAASAFTIRGI
ncbi:MAG TPA: ABC transporter ATP-binding protein [Longimicrobiaceae bacterium]|nr:ABC transporter ATP-binding protein [Longimicrobiaceae bacterium]